jgi:4-amino-4-deoxy-L-arabinose transferase-like glycosyltransferase
MRINKLIILSTIFLVAVFLRFWQIDKVPPSLYWDEVSQGYNAYSILKTGRDEHGEFLPIARFKAFGDYKAPVYIYLDVPFIGIFGKTMLGVRFPSALFGSLTVLLTYLLVNELFYKYENRRKLALWSAFFLAISPWHIQLSRAAYEANIATFFTILGVYLFLLARRAKPKYFILSTTSFVLGFYAFNAHRVFIPLLSLLLGVIYLKDLLKVKKYIGISIVLGLILLAPFIAYLRTPESKLRFNEVNIFSDLDIIKQSNKLIAQSNNSILAKVFANRRVLYSLSYAQHYLDFFNPSYLFFSGDVNPRFSLRDYGELFLWELPLLMVGFYLLISQKTKSTLLIIGWFLLAPIAGAIARETPHALRSETFIPTYEIVTALGMVWIINLLKNVNKYLSRLLILIISLIIISSVYVFLHDYFVHFPVNFSYDWQYGYKEAVSETEKLKNQYDYVVFSDTYGRPYIYVAFYSNISPSDFWKESSIQIDPFGFYTVSKVGKYIFRNKLVQDSDAGKKVLYVGKPDQIPLSFTVLNKINFLNGNTAFVIAKN